MGNGLERSAMSAIVDKVHPRYRSMESRVGMELVSEYMLAWEQYYGKDMYAFAVKKMLIDSAAEGTALYRSAAPRQPYYRVLPIKHSAGSERQMIVLTRHGLELVALGQEGLFREVVPMEEIVFISDL